jgi:hypothetical protein
MTYRDPPQSLGAALRKSIEKTRLRKKIDAACRQAMAGKTRDEARVILVEQYREHGEEPPGQPLLDARLDFLRRPTSTADTAKDWADGVAAVVGFGRGLKKVLTDEHPGDDEPHADLMIIPDWNHTARVELVDDAETWLGEIEGGLVRFRDVTTVNVDLQATGAREAGGRIVVSNHDRRVGLVAEENIDELWSVLGLEGTEGFPVASTHALRTRDTQTGLWRLDLGMPKSTHHRGAPFGVVLDDEADDDQPDPYPDLDLEDLIGLPPDEAEARAKAAGVERVRVIRTRRGAIRPQDMDLVVDARRLYIFYEHGRVEYVLLPNQRDAGK